MEEKKLGLPKAFICCSNILFLMSGFVLMSCGALLLADSHRVLLSRLLGSEEIYQDQPMFYYFAFIIVAVGFIISVTGLLGCWATCLHNCCITTTYILMIILLMMVEISICTVVIFFPQYLGIDLQPSRLIRALQRNYAVPGREQFTAALDLAQSVFSCCGINGSSNYGTSWWRLQEVGRRELVVPLTCCTLNNVSVIDAFLNPEPSNLTLCQALNPAEHLRARHLNGCLEKIENWTDEQELILITTVLGLMFIELCALSSTLFACLKSKKSKKHPSAFTSTQTLSPFSESEHEFGMGIENRMHMAGTTFGAKSWRRLEGSEVPTISVAGIKRIEKIPYNTKRSVIEEWQDSNKGINYIIPNDQHYEERAIDVFPTIPSTSCTKTSSNRRKTSIPRSKSSSTRGKKQKSEHRSSKKRTSSQRVHRNSKHTFSHDRQRSLVDSPSTIDVESSEGMPLINKKQHTKKRNTTKPPESEDQDGSIDSLECCNIVDHQKQDPRQQTDIRRSKRKDTFNTNGNSTKRISSQLENTCCSQFEEKVDSRLGMTEVPRFKTLGVPLVGMHNACGLPVFAHWQKQKISTSLRKSNHVHRDNSNRAQSKIYSRDSHPRHNSSEADFKSEWIMIKETNRPYSSASHNRRRPSFKVVRVGTLSTKKLAKNSKDNLKKESIIYKFGGSFGRRSVKRTALYAKNGEEAVSALKKLCLNPLGRSSKGDVMIWWLSSLPIEKVDICKVFNCQVKNLADS